MNHQHPFKWRHFEAEIILLCVRWSLRYSLSSRDLEERMLERGLHVDHSTMYRWVQRYAPECPVVLATWDIRSKKCVKDASPSSFSAPVVATSFHPFRGKQ